MGLAVFVIILIIFDQLSKLIIQANIAAGEWVPVIPGFFALTHIYNKGAAWGFLSDADHGGLFLTLLALLMSLALIWAVRRLKDRGARIAFALILAGSLGNLIDRFRLGMVVDFLSFRFGRWYFPSFNVADSCIVIGCCFLVIYLFMKPKALDPLFEKRTSSHEGDADRQKDDTCEKK